ncbi:MULTISPECIES: AAA family ATPase [Stenotrophomonas]|uniref:AAA family ATPase n=1 Tax=Stenotrophomonas TaxID=40323 RepID=UPI000DB05DCD|nr:MULTISPECIES: AAA family ATPase [Stenotrophomonas]MBA0429977.1 AAA family ATPase [Stenotrophomonas maltophilia]MDH0274148.1 AAA family ATPase [Stenotrophomonas sp. GD04089]MDH1910629.1 AAA family ATPase [Stenotrophomonas sp. GD03794]PZP60298.1 MAG: recombination factor protein RarA [Pseudoxanthomonas spadix]
MSEARAPLAERLRPVSLAGVVGQSHLLADGQPLQRALEAGLPRSIILWGPPGCGKTSIAQLLLGASGHRHTSLPAAVMTPSELGRALAVASHQAGRGHLLFVDEVHRLDRATQDVLVRHLQGNDARLLAATTENPSFQLRPSLLQRCDVHVLQPLQPIHIAGQLRRALVDGMQGLAHCDLKIDDDVLGAIAVRADGDLRRALNALEILADLAPADGRIPHSLLDDALPRQVRRFDKQGELFYDQISAAFKSVRSTNPDAALYWICRMLDGGCDPRYLARNLSKMAIEDIGLSDPRAQTRALEAWKVLERFGDELGAVALANTALYLGATHKSNATVMAWLNARSRSGSPADAG